LRLNRWLRGVVGLAAVWLAAAPAARGLDALDAIDVPLDHWSYAVLEKFELRAALPRTFLDLRPITRGEAAVLVQQTERAAAAGTWSPTRIERAQLDMLRAEFSPELLARGDTVPLAHRAYHVWSGDAWRLRGFWEGGERIQSRPDAGFSPPPVDTRIVLEPAVALAIGTRIVAVERLSYRVRTSDAALTQSSDVRYGEAELLFEPRDRFSITRTVEPYVRYAGNRFRLDLGRFRLRWGPGRQNAMLLQDGTPPFDQVRLQLRLGPVRFTSLAGQLRAARLRTDDPELRERYVSLHRLEVAPHARLHLAFSEAIVYGNRGFDLSYVNPISVFFVTQANNGDVDNALASLDGRWRVGRGGEVYGECVLDDLNLRRGLRNFGNKPGLLVGGRWQAPFGARDWDVDAEWSWASQYLYTHHYPVNRYQHFGGTLGSRTGPDADLWTVALRRQWTRGWSLAAAYELERHGEGSLADDHEHRTSDEQEYLSGVTESHHRPGLVVEYQGLRSLGLRLDVRSETVRNPGHVTGATSRTGLALRFETRLEL